MELSRLKKLLSLTDFTSLGHTDDFAQMERFCQKALSLKTAELPGVAALCVYPAFLEMTLSMVRDVYPVAVVAGGFPHAQLPFRMRLNEIMACANQGAHEIDIVVPFHQVAAGQYATIESEIRSIKGQIGFRCLKVILETGLMSTEQITATSKAALNAGADFIKTSTGKNGQGATLEATALMIAEIKAATGMRGLKPSGGIRTVEDADAYASQFETAFGTEELTADHFRIGASSLVDEIVLAMEQDHGVQI